MIGGRHTAVALSTTANAANFFGLSCVHESVLKLILHMCLVGGQTPMRQVWHPFLGTETVASTEKRSPSNSSQVSHLQRWGNATSSAMGRETH